MAKGKSNEGPDEMVMVTTGLPPVDVRVGNATIVHDGESYSEGDVIKDVDGPLAQTWEASGFVTIL